MNMDWSNVNIGVLLDYYTTQIDYFFLGVKDYYGY